MKAHIIFSFGLVVFSTSAVAQAQQEPAIVENLETFDLSQLQTPDVDLLREAASFQKEKNYGRAISLLTDLLQFHPNGSYNDEALYRLAECYRSLGRFEDARAALKIFRQKYSAGQWAPAADLLEGEMLAAEKKWMEALGPLKRGTASPNTQIAARAHYLVTIAYLNLNRLEDARPNLQALVVIAQNNPYLNFARVKLAALLRGEGAKTDGLRMLRQALDNELEPELKEEALIRAGTLAYELDLYDEAAGYFGTIIESKASDYWKKLARLGMLQTLFAQKNYSGFLKLYKTMAKEISSEQLSSEQFAGARFMRAEALRLTEQTGAALQEYEAILKQYPGNSLAESCAWGRLSILSKKSPETFPEEAADFLKTYPQSEKVIPVEVMRADALYAARRYSEALEAMNKLAERLEDLLQIPKDARDGLRFKRAHAAFLMKDAALAERAFGDFLRAAPAHPLAATALWIQGQAQLAQDKQDAALATWENLLDRHQAFPERETALWQTALLAGSKKSFTKLDQRLGQLLKEYPATTRAAEAHYWLAISAQERKDSESELAHWLEARKLDTQKYFQDATQQIIRIQLKKGDLAALRAEVDRYDQWRSEHPHSPPVAIEVYEWLGQELLEKGNLADGERFLRGVLEITEDKEQKKRVLIRLALALTEAKNHVAAIDAWETYRKEFPDEGNRTVVLEPLAQAYIAVGVYDNARDIAEQILLQNPEGQFNLRGQLLLGDIAMARGNYAEAGRTYARATVLFIDPDFTPIAIDRAEKAYRKAGDNERADKFSLQLRQEYPKYKSAY